MPAAACPTAAAGAADIANVVSLLAARLALEDGPEDVMVTFRDQLDGAIYFKDGKVARRRCEADARAVRSRRGISVALAGGGPDQARTAGPFGRLGALLAATERALDAAMELLSSESHYGKFRPITAASPAHHGYACGTADPAARRLTRG